MNRVAFLEKDCSARSVVSVVRQSPRMPTETLEFEESLAPLLKEVDALSALPRTEARERELERLNQRLRARANRDLRKLTPWQRVLVARHPSRPDMLHYVVRLFTDFVELHGDRRFADDHAIVAGTACYKGEPIMVVGHHKGGDTKQKIYRNFGYARPEGYRKAIRLMRMAEKFQRARSLSLSIRRPPIPGVESEERGVAEAIAFNLREMSVLKVPIVVVITGEGGSGGALGIAIGDRILMQEYAIYSVIPPEGCAAILWRDSQKKVEAATALKLTAPDLLGRGIIDEIVPRADRRRAHERRRSGHAARRPAARRARSRRAPPTSTPAWRGATRSSATWAGWAQILRTMESRVTLQKSSPQRTPRAQRKRIKESSA